jgi:hypothetical protein
MWCYENVPIVTHIHHVTFAMIVYETHKQD